MSMFLLVEIRAGLMFAQEPVDVSLPHRQVLLASCEILRERDMIRHICLILMAECSELDTIFRQMSSPMQHGGVMKDPKTTTCFNHGCHHGFQLAGHNLPKHFMVLAAWRA